MPPPAQIEIVISAPGRTGRVNLPSIEVNLAGSLPHTACSSARPVYPYVHMPCRIGRSKPPLAANLGSECSGFLSPVSRYSSAWSAGMR